MMLAFFLNTLEQREEVLVVPAKGESFLESDSGVIGGSIKPTFWR
ncbi:MAG: hypothetical protein ACE5JU_17835 [Candidatus Binatia bacterium]